MPAAIAEVNLVVLDQAPPARQTEIDLLIKKCLARGEAKAPERAQSRPHQQILNGQCFDRPKLDGEFGMRHSHACNP